MDTQAERLCCVQFILKQPAEYRNYKSRNFLIRVHSKSGTLYGTYRVGWPCGDSPCGKYTSARMGKK